MPRRGGRVDAAGAPSECDRSSVHAPRRDARTTECATRPRAAEQRGQETTLASIRRADALTHRPRAAVTRSARGSRSRRKRRRVMPDPSAPSRSPTREQDQRVPDGKLDRARRPRVARCVPRIVGSASSLPSTSSTTATSAPARPQSSALDHERAAHEPVRRADELHHLDLAPPREDREPDRVRDQHRRRRRAGPRATRKTSR